MPWSIKKIEKKFCVVKTGETVPIDGGCHDNRDDAAAQVRALYASEAEFAIVEAALTEFNPDEEHGGEGEWVPKLGLPPAHVEQMAFVAKSLKGLAKMIFTAHYDEAPRPGPDVRMMPDNAPYVYSEEETAILAAAGKGEVEEFAWEGPIAFEGVATGDNRYFKHGAMEWDDNTFPIPFRWQKSSVPGHTGAVPIGRVDHMERKEDGTIYAYGVVIPSLNEEAAEYLRLLESGVASGVSVDGDSAVFDVRELADGKQSVEFSKMRIRSLTAVDIPAFNEAQVDLVEDAEDNPEDVEELARKKKKKAMRWNYSGMTAAGAPIKPPTEWFVDPKLTEPTPITVTKNGQIFGYLALFNSCHIGFPGSCVSPPKGSSYKYFHTGEIETDDGDTVEVGHLTFNTGHAAMSDTAKMAAAHYDHTGTVAADVRCGEDKFGIWVAGAIRPHLDDLQIRAFRAAPLSGDWRRIAGRLELVGALAVNTPGFPVPRTRSLVASGETETLLIFQEAETGVRLNKKAELAQRVGIVKVEPPSISLSDRREELAARVNTLSPENMETVNPVNLRFIYNTVETSARSTVLATISIGEESFDSSPSLKMEDGEKFPKGDYAYSPSDFPGSWKLRLTSIPGGNPDPGIVGAAVAALGKGFRGQKVQIPAEDLPAVKKKVLAAWLAADTSRKEEDVPDVLK